MSLMARYIAWCREYFKSLRRKCQVAKRLQCEGDLRPVHRSSAEVLGFAFSKMRSEARCEQSPSLLPRRNQSIVPVFVCSQNQKADTNFYWPQQDDYIASNHSFYLSQNITMANTSLCLTPTIVVPDDCDARLATPGSPHPQRHFASPDQVMGIDPRHSSFSFENSANDASQGLFLPKFDARPNTIGGSSSSAVPKLRLKPRTGVSLSPQRQVQPLGLSMDRLFLHD